jgi:hypothetical protein
MQSVHHAVRWSVILYEIHQILQRFRIGFVHIFAEHQRMIIPAIFYSRQSILLLFTFAL